MKPLEILIVFGTRPEAIKLAPVLKQLRRYPNEIKVRACATGQHREMLDQVMDLFEIAPDFDLGLMRPNQTPNQVASLILAELDRLFSEKPFDWMLVQGDTTTVMAASIAAHHHRIKVGHVEAGLRTYDRSNPFPEEMNRVVTDHVSDLHFAPTSTARDNLLREGIKPERVFVTGNTVIDALEWVAEKPVPASLTRLFARLNSTKPLLLVTAHRRESQGKPLRNICNALRALARRDNLQIVFPVHRNPNVWEPVHRELKDVKGITLLPPVDYLSLVHLMKRSRLILTDSGGIQEEAPSLGVPVLVLRESTERPEAVAAGAARLVGTDPLRIVNEAERVLNDPVTRSKMSRAINPYGDGKAAERIVKILLHGRCEEFVCEDLVAV